MPRVLVPKDFSEPSRCRARVHTEVTVGRAVDDLVRLAKDQHADLVPLEVHGHTGETARSTALPPHLGGLNDFPERRSEHSSFDILMGGPHEIPVADIR
jgi:hypothetical protein